MGNGKEEFQNNPTNLIYLTWVPYLTLPTSSFFRLDRVLPAKSCENQGEVRYLFIPVSPLTCYLSVPESEDIGCGCVSCACKVGEMLYK